MSTTGPPITSAAGAYLRINIRNLAVAEETYFTDSGSYTTGSATLKHYGYKAQPGTGSDTLLVALNQGVGYCVVATTGSEPWILYDSQKYGGFAPQTFAQRSAAEAACTQAVGAYKRVR